MLTSGLILPLPYFVSVVAYLFPSLNWHIWYLNPIVIWPNILIIEYANSGYSYHTETIRLYKTI